MGLVATYDVHLRLIGTLVVEFFINVIIALLSLGVRVEALRANID